MSNLAFKVQPRLGGLFDWLFKRKTPGLVPVKPAYPAPVPKGSVFDILRRRREEQTGLPAPLPPPLPPPAPPPEPKKSMFEIFAPKPKEPPKETMFSIYAPPAPGAVVPVQPTMFDIFAPGQKGALTQYAEKSFEMFRQEPEPEPAGTFEAAQAKQAELWENLFPEDPKSQASMFEAFRADEVADPDELRKSYKNPCFNQLAVLPLPPKTTLLPDPEDVARGFLTLYGDDVWDNILDMIHGRDYTIELWEYARGAATGELDEYEYAPFLNIDTICTYTMCSVPEDVALCLYFGIPLEWIGEIIREHGGQPDYEQWDIEEYEIVSEYIVQDLLQVFEDAMEIIKPPFLPGQVFLHYNDNPDYECDWWIVYWDQERYEDYKTRRAPPGSFEEQEIMREAKKRGEYPEEAIRYPSSGVVSPFGDVAEEEEKEEFVPEPPPPPKPKAKKKKKKSK